MVTNDFGFSLVSEEELRKHEEALKKQIAEQTQLTIKVNQNAQQLNAKIKGVVDMITPLLNNLASDPTKDYIFWPNRVEKIQQFQQKLQDYINSND